MKNKLVFFILCFFISITVLTPYVVLGKINNNIPLQEQFSEGEIKGVDTFFEIKNSEYLNVTLQSVEEIKMRLESVPKIISLNIGASDDSVDSTGLIISGLEPNKTYNKYQDSYKNKAVFVSDNKGSYTWQQDIATPHHIWFQEVLITEEPNMVLENRFFSALTEEEPLEPTITFLPDQCADFGVWDEILSTCTLNKNINQDVEIIGDNLTLDCSNNQIMGNNFYGINLFGRAGISIKNCIIFGNMSGININSSSEIFLENNTINGVWGGVDPFYSSNTIIKNNKITGGTGDSINFHYTDNNIVENNILNGEVDFYYSNNNIFIDNTVIGEDYGGVYFYYADSNTFTGNNITGSVYFYYVDNNIFTDNNIIGGVGFDNSSNNEIKKNTVKGGWWGCLYLNKSNNNNIFENILTGSENEGIGFYNSNNNKTSDNTINANIWGVDLYDSANNVFTNNVIKENEFEGIGLYNSFSISFFDNDISNNGVGLGSYFSYDIKIYHNNFVDNFLQAEIYEESYDLDNGLPDGGNYWSNYAGADLNGDGIGDTYYTFYGGQDNYPFMVQSGWNKPTKTPVLIVPGLLGTELKKGNDMLWLNPAMVNPLNNDFFMDPLQFLNSLSPLDIQIIIADVIKLVKVSTGGIEFTLFNYSEGLINEFKNQGYVEGLDLFTFPYDWRYGVTGKYADGKTNANLLEEKIQQIMAQTGASKVDVIAHSMGGLITKKYVMDSPTNNHIGKAVFVGVPNTGAPKSVKVLLQGDNFGVLGLNDQEVKKISENMPASYDLLPSQHYYNAKGSYIKTIDQTKCSEDYTIPCEVKDLNYQESNDFLISQGFNSLGLDGAENLHTQDFDNFDLRTTGIDLYAIDGCKSATLNKIVYTKYNDIFGQQFSYDLRFAPGDGTVPLESSTNLPIDLNNKFYSLSGSHSKMLSANGSRQKIVNLISGSNLDVGTAYGESLITQDISKCKLNGKAISVFSPVDIFVTDQNGNKLGLAEDGSIINEIPNADFEVMGEHKFLYLPQDNGQVYNITMQGTDNGTYTIKSQNIINSQPENMEVFKDLPVTPALTGQINFDSDNLSTLTVKQSLADLPVTIIPIEVSNNYVDKTSPEVVIQFDPVAKDLKFTGTDNITENAMVMVYDKDDKVVLKDGAENTTEIKLKGKDRKKLMLAEIKSIKYNGISTDISKNNMTFLWLYDKNKNIKMLSQYVKSKKDYNILAVYDGKNTKITGKDSSGKISKVFSGLKIIKVVTNKGDLSWSY